MDTEVAAARLRMTRVQNAAQAMKNQPAPTVKGASFQEVLHKNGQAATDSNRTADSSRSSATGSGGSDGTPAGGCIQGLMRSESYRSPGSSLTGAAAPDAGVSVPASGQTPDAGHLSELSRTSDIGQASTTGRDPEAGQVAGTAPAACSSAEGGDNSVPRAEDFDSLDELLAAFGGLSSNPVRKEDWINDKPEHWTDEEFERSINRMNYRYSLLDADRLPYGLTRPEEGKSSSTDIVDTKFVQCTGGIQRIDYYSTGDREHHTFIPVMEWRHVTSGGGIDPLVGDTYSMQTPFGFKVTFMRGSSGTPSGYADGGFQRKVDSLLAQG